MNNLRRLSNCHSILDLRDCARRRLPGPVFHFLDGAAESEGTATANITAFERQSLIPRCLVDVSSVSTTTRVLGQDIAWPLICSPTGGSRVFHPEGELAVARAAESAGALYSLATGSTYSLEDVAATTRGPKLFQLYMYKNRDITRELISRCKRAGYSALCLTVDTPVIGKRERDLHWGFGERQRWSLRSLASYASRPAWVFGLVSHAPLSLANFPHGTPGPLAQMDPAITWRDVRDVIDQWGGPFALKGVMSVDDARRAADAGVTAVVVSNHGGRQLDGAAPSFEALPKIVQAVGDRVEVILDGGVRRGVHILKALASGARACSIGRPYLYGLSAGGEAGVRRALEILRTELIVSMKLSGCPDVRGLDSTLLSDS